jgi:hypothetical protein
MKDNNKPNADELISKIFSEDDPLRSYLKVDKPQTDVLTEEQKRDNFIKAILDAGKPKQTK